MRQVPANVPWPTAWERVGLAPGSSAVRNVLSAAMTYSFAHSSEAIAGHCPVCLSERMAEEAKTRAERQEAERQASLRKCEEEIVAFERLRRISLANHQKDEMTASAPRTKGERSL